MNDGIPEPRTWEERRNDVTSLPGGYSGYLHSLQRICEHLERGGISREEFVEWIRGAFSVTEITAKMYWRFLKAAGFIEERDGIAIVAEPSRRWLRDRKDHLLIVAMHGRVKFIGEMLRELAVPKSSAKLRDRARAYGLEWGTNEQINRRRGWLQSAGLVEFSNGLMRLTLVGKEVLERLEVFAPDEIRLAPDTARNTNSPKSLEVQTDLVDAPGRTGEAPSVDVPTPEQLALEIKAASTDSANPTRFERTVCEAFDWLGFEAEHLGGSGKTDVLLTAPLGSCSYRVAVDAKTTASGSLGDGQVDWVTLSDHRKVHDARYSLLVAPNPSGKRLLDRASDYSVSILSAERLASLCRCHGKTPLSPFHYERLFQRPGEMDTSVLDNAVKEITQLQGLAAAICRDLPEETDRNGPMSARDVQLTLGQGFTDLSKDRIGSLLDMLAHPLIGVVHRVDDGAGPRYVPATRPEASKYRIHLLGDRMAAASLTGYHG